MTSRPEVTIDHGRRRQEPLCLVNRFEPLHLPFSSSSRWSMRIFGSIVQVPARPMPDIRKYRSLSNTVAAQPVGDEAPRYRQQPVQDVLIIKNTGPVGG
jgi:hypothetical protein